MRMPGAIDLSCFLLLLALSSAAGAGADEFATTFCPECWKFLDAKDDACFDGTCLACGRTGVAVDAGELAWILCPAQDSWRRWPCAEEWARRTGTVRSALAMVVASGDERLRSEAYCPECRIFPDPMNMERGRCPSCKGPLASIDIVEPMWFWCERTLHWRSEPCAEHRSKPCCIARRGTVPAKVRRISP